MREEPFVTLQTAREETGLSVEELWILYFALGGQADMFDVDLYLAGAGPLDRHEHNILALALNEQFMELDQDQTVPYLED
jgi:hypothetical protein